MSSSSKWSRKKGVHRRPHVCHPPPPPPLPPPPPPPTCPPASIGGWIDAEWGAPPPPFTEYYSAYTAVPDPEEPLRYLHTNGPGFPYHELEIHLQADPALISIDLMIHQGPGDSRSWAKAGIPFTWCQHNVITNYDWDEEPVDAQFCTVHMSW